MNKKDRIAVAISVVWLIFVFSALRLSGDASALVMLVPAILYWAYRYCFVLQYIQPLYCNNFLLGLRK